MTLAEILKPEVLTGVLEKLRFNQRQFVFVSRIPVNRIDGDTATWTVEYRRAKVDSEMVGRDGPAQPVKHATYARKTFAMPYTFKVLPLPGDSFLNLQDPSTGQIDRGLRLLSRQVQLLEELYGQYLDEYLCAKMFEDSVPIVIDGVTVNVTYGVPTSHKVSSAQGWSTATTDILPTIRSAKRLIAQDSGRMAAFAFLNDATADYLRKNDLITRMYASTTAGERMLAEGDLPPIGQLTWVIHEGRYTTSDGASLDSTFIPDDHVLFTPEFPNGPEDWVEIQEGSFTIPNADHTGFRVVRGRASWARVSDSPTGLNVYLKRCRFPVLRGPESIFRYTNVA